MFSKKNYSSQFFFCSLWQLSASCCLTLAMKTTKKHTSHEEKVSWFTHNKNQSTGSWRKHATRKTPSNEIDLLIRFSPYYMLMGLWGSFRAAIAVWIFTFKWSFSSSSACKIHPTLRTDFAHVWEIKFMYCHYLCYGTMNKPKTAAIYNYVNPKSYSYFPNQ